jgi:nicotinic acetylcholine receptor
MKRGFKVLYFLFQIITVNCWLDQTWNDTHLTWNASDFGGITTIGLPYDKVWRPDIILYNK